MVGHGPFYAKYELLEGDGSCAELKGGEIGLSTYLAPNADRSLADYDDRRIAVQSRLLGDLLHRGTEFGVADEDNKPYAIGDYTNLPDDGNICYAGGANGTPALSVAEQSVPEIPAMDDGMGGMTDPIPAEHLRQEWRNLKIYVTPQAPGTQMTGEMTLENVLEGCSARYRVVALFPSVYCGVDADGDENTPDVASNEQCDPEADPDQGREFGSGINPDWKTKCDPELLHCVLDETPLPDR
ncbi:hypothetical protein [Polyangium aurulentum]|uniref:hypothetical protein n=1 Tax=Polyangium aurulentum TaxID=2567896 RepID=UPI0020109F08|nr:hypothetical protein [Polyangium aurulentum]UQA57895.1 hypothetical protein E8A73_042580 [Polyangium aurulentum]